MGKGVTMMMARVTGQSQSQRQSQRHLHLIFPTDDQRMHSTHRKPLGHQHDGHREAANQVAEQLLSLYVCVGGGVRAKG
jgi:hypothetical protein